MRVMGRATQGVRLITFKGEDEIASIAKVEHEEDEVKKVVNQDLTGTETILLVEDETPVRIFASRALANKGYKILEAENAEIAMEIFEKESEKIDLVISDVIMPGMNGPTMVREFHKKIPGLKVIFMSGYTEDALSDYEGKPEELNFLQKPFSLKDLAAKAKEVLTK